MKIQTYKLFTAFFSVLAYIIWFFTYTFFESTGNVTDTQICIVSWVGISVFVAYIIIWKQLTGRFLSLFSLFLCFFTLFNFGQAFLWAFGIHTTLKNEIGNAPLYGVVSHDKSVTIRALLMYIICYITLNLGAILSWRSEDKARFKASRCDWNNDNDQGYYKLYVTSAVILAVAFPATMYIAVRNFVLGQIYSYHDLYYGNLGEIPTYVTILDGLFFPALLGVLIGRKYERKIRRNAYVMFFLYAAMTLLCGDRGEWINKLAILFWADTWFYKKLATKKIIMFLALGVVGLYILVPFVELRNVGLSIDGIRKVYSSLSLNPIISMIVEFGHSMGISMVLIKNNVFFPFGNSYLMSFPTILSTRWAEIIFGIKYVQLSTWFSSDYLKISYGADFSMIGEAILNFGIYFAPVIIGILGAIISGISKLPLARKMSPLKACLSIAAMEPILKMSRSTFWYPLTKCTYFICIFVFAYSIVSLYMRNREGR